MKIYKKKRIAKVVKSWLIASILGLFAVVPAQAQSDDQTATIEAIRQAGGRAAPISAIDKELDVSFHLSDQPVGDEQLKLLKNLPKIRWLNLANTKITDKGLAELSQLKTLTKLHLEKTGIGDQGLTHLKDLDQLVYLNIYGTQVTDAGLESLAGLKNLRHLYVWQSKVSPDGIRQLQAKLPDLKIVGQLKLAPVAKPASDEKKQGADGDQQSKSNDKVDEKKDGQKKDDQSFGAK